MSCQLESLCWIVLVNSQSNTPVHERKKVNVRALFGLYLGFFFFFFSIRKSSYLGSFSIPFHQKYCLFSILKPCNLSAVAFTPCWGLAGLFLPSLKKIVCWLFISPLGNWILSSSPFWFECYFCSLSDLFFDTLFLVCGFTCYYPGSFFVLCFVHSSFVISLTHQHSYQEKFSPFSSLF